VRFWLTIIQVYGIGQWERGINGHVSRTERKVSSGVLILGRLNLSEVTVILHLFNIRDF